MSTLPKAPLTPEQYLEMERKAEFKSEYYRGEMFAMAGGSSQNSRLAARLIALIDRHCDDRGCSVFTSDLKVLVESAGLYTYPDVSVACGGPLLADQQRDVLLNPCSLSKCCRPPRSSTTVA